MSTKVKQSLYTIAFILIAIALPIIIFSFKYPKLWDFERDTVWKVSGLVITISIVLLFVFRKFVKARIKALRYGFWKVFLTVAPAIIGAWVLFGLVYGIHLYFAAFSYVTMVIAICESVAWGVIYPILMHYDYILLKEEREDAVISAMKKAGVVQV
jgi:cation transport ATPase